MEQRDYLLKQAELLGQVLGKILDGLLRLKSQGTVNVSIANYFFKEELDFDINDLVTCQADDLINTLVVKKGFNTVNLEKMADILFLIADCEDLQEREHLYRKILLIYEYINKSGNTFSYNRFINIEKIKKYI